MGLPLGTIDGLLWFEEDYREVGERAVIMDGLSIGQQQS